MMRSLDDKGQFSLWLDDVNEYGCWCYFGDKHGAGKSQPVNELDEHCKQLHEGYECAMLDDADEDCSPWTVSYSPVNYLSRGAKYYFQETRLFFCNIASKTSSSTNHPFV